MQRRTHRTPRLVLAQSRCPDFELLGGVEYTQSKIIGALVFSVFALANATVMSMGSLPPHLGNRI